MRDHGGVKCAIPAARYLPALPGRECSLRWVSTSEHKRSLYYRPEGSIVPRGSLEGSALRSRCGLGSGWGQDVKRKQVGGYVRIFFFNSVHTRCKTLVPHVCVLFTVLSARRHPAQPVSVPILQSYCYREINSKLLILVLQRQALTCDTFPTPERYYYGGPQLIGRMVYMKT